MSLRGDHLSDNVVILSMERKAPQSSDYAPKP